MIWWKEAHAMGEVDNTLPWWRLHAVHAGMGAECLQQQRNILEMSACNSSVRIGNECVQPMIEAYMLSKLMNLCLQPIIEA